MGKLDGKVAVVTGGATGIGRAAARRFIEEGATVFIFGRRQEALDAGVADLGANARGVTGSVSDEADLDRLYAAVKAERGTLDIVFANAGAGSMAKLGDITAEHIDETFDTNVKGTILTVQKALPLMREGGSIILSGLATDEAYVGLSYAMKSRPDGTSYTTCCSQVFDPDGVGFRFVAYDAKEFTQDGRNNPFLSYYEMQSVLSRSLNIYQGGHLGRVPKKVTIHKNTSFKEEEILGALDSFKDGTEVELVQIVKDVEWKGVRFDSRSPPQAANYPVERGTYLPIESDEALLWTQGSVAGVNVQRAGQDVYKEGMLKPVPSPVLLRRFSGAGGWHETCAGVLGLTKMDWNNNTLYKKLPVTLVYSARFAAIIQQNPNIVDTVYDFRNFM